MRVVSVVDVGDIETDYVLSFSCIFFFHGCLHVILHYEDDISLIYEFFCQRVICPASDTG